MHADGAWGGYLNCMTHKTHETNVHINRLDTAAHDFVPTIPLSDFVEKQYISLQYADTGKNKLNIHAFRHYCNWSKIVLDH